MSEEQNQEGVQLSIVSAVYRSQAIVPEFVKRVRKAAAETALSFEIILVEDGGQDGSWEAIREVCRQDMRIKGVRLSRNFGQHPAITAGLAAAVGNYVIVMDCDLQENPQYIPELVRKAQAGAEIVFTLRTARQFSIFRNIIVRPFYFLFNYFVDDRKMAASSREGTFSLLTRKVVDAFLSIKDTQRHYLRIVRWLGFQAQYVEVIHEVRHSGKSSYTFKKLLWHAIDGITSQSNKLLRLSVKVGISFCLLAFAGVVYLTVMYFISGFKEGWASIAVLILFCTGMILMMLGIQGLYIGNIFDQSRERPIFIVAETENLPEIS